MKPYTDDLAAMRMAYMGGVDGRPCVFPENDSSDECEIRLQLAIAERLERLIELVEQRLWLPIAVPAQPFPPMPPVTVREDGTGAPPPDPPTTTTSLRTSIGKCEGCAGPIFEGDGSHYDTDGCWICPTCLGDGR